MAKPEIRALTFLAAIVIGVKLINYFWPTSEFTIAMDQTLRNW